MVWLLWETLIYVKKSFQKDADDLPLETANHDENDDELYDKNTISKKQQKKDQKWELLEQFGLSVRKIQRNTLVN